MLSSEQDLWHLSLQLLKDPMEFSAPMKQQQKLLKMPFRGPKFRPKLAALEISARWYWLESYEG